MKRIGLAIAFLSCLFFINIKLCFATDTEMYLNGIKGFNKNQFGKKEKHSAQYILKLQKWAKLNIENFGKKAFRNIAERNKILDENYILVLDQNGHLIDGVVDRAIKNNIMNMDDDRVKMIKNIILKEARKKNGGWIHFMSTKKSNFQTRIKTANVQMAESPSGRKYILVCGTFNILYEDIIAEEMVNDFIRDFVFSNDDFFPTFNIKSSIWNKECYMFLFDTKGNMIFCPPFKSLEGRNLYNFRDCLGKQMFKEMIDMALDKGSGWVDYQWCKPGEHNSVDFRVFFHKITGYNRSLMIVAAGYYPDLTTLEAE